ncbi:YkgJ family cysteine cluster protein [Novosphingobium piscinae]|uniref:YkgJ family cysteine cluster protein n=1 Tax=Novosphingobium piscinae TaxID=1507448 RepID=A0A7X1FVQ0_9SPHN|nr:YkgJ family cysteine cluster protein [Novosphingobium piscinae]MBC2667850.1 YkgJ family cysteine cluster protein [Novosphingobium piscinae]
MDLHFECTQCGQCCHGLRLTLSVDEAIAWADNGHCVEVLTEALPYHPDDHGETAQAGYDRSRSFPAVSGEMPLRIAAVLVAFHEGACPHLRPDMRCGNYAARPRICRIYPLESRPFMNVSPERRLCPPEAWAPSNPCLMRGDHIADPALAEIVADHRRTLMDDVPVVASACAALNISTAAFANEGFAVHQPDGRYLSAELKRAKSAQSGGPTPQPWTVVTNRESTRSLLVEAGCIASTTRRGPSYLGSFADDV